MHAGRRWQTSPDLSVSTGDRQPTWNCDAKENARIVAGQNLTAITFYDIIPAEEYGQPYVGMHLHYQVYYSNPGEPNQAYRFSNDNPESDGISIVYEVPINSMNSDPYFPDKRFGVVDGCPDLESLPNGKTYDWHLAESKVVGGSWTTNLSSSSPEAKQHDLVPSKVQSSP